MHGQQNIKTSTRVLSSAKFPRLMLRFYNFLMSIYLGDRTYKKGGARGTYGSRRGAYRV